MLRCCALVLGIFFVLNVAPAAAQSGGRIIFFEGFNGRDSAFNGHRVMSGDGSAIRDLPEIPVTQLGRFTLNQDGSRVAFATPQGLFSANARFGNASSSLRGCVSRTDSLAREQRIGRPQASSSCTPA